MEKTFTMTQAKETKGTVVYKAEGEAVDSLYVSKVALPKPYPAEIEGTIKARA